MNVWRIGSNWGGVDIFPIFLEHGIAFTGTTAEEYVARVKVGDLIAVTNGQPIIAVAKVKRIGFLRDISVEYAKRFADVSCLHLDKIYRKEGFPTIDFGYYDGQGKKFHEAHDTYRDDIFRLFNQLTSQSMNQEIVQLLKYKKQIILQGPPGTGKTKLAKELASELVGDEPEKTGNTAMIDKAAIQRMLKDVSTTIKTKSGKDLKIIEIKDGTVDVKTDDSKVWHPSYNKIIDSYNNRLFNDAGRTGGFKPYEDAIAKYLFENHRTPEKETASGQVKLIQFHPSYSYEDFVRGIVAKPNEEGEGILYEAENKILAEFAKAAHQNYLNSKKTSETLSEEQRLDAGFELFTDMIAHEVNENGKYELTEKAYIYKVDAQLFRYTGDNWDVKSRRRMKFSDLKMEYLADVQQREDIKNLKTISMEAREESSYGLNMVNKLRSFIASNKISLPNVIEQQKNYVLIIDEINRANLSSVLGELIYALEYRGEQVESMYEVDGSNALVLPPNLYIIGTMNTADRSLGHIDYAIRRRFAFADVHPKDLSPELGPDFNKALFDQVAALFDNHLSAEFEKKDVQLGHSYFIDKTKDGGSMAIRLQYEVKPLLMEYIRDGVLKDSKELRGAIANLEQKIV